VGVGPQLSSTSTPAGYPVKQGGRFAGQPLRPGRGLSELECWPLVGRLHEVDQRRGRKSPPGPVDRKASASPVLQGRVSEPIHGWYEGCEAPGPRRGPEKTTSGSENRRVRHRPWTVVGTDTQAPHVLPTEPVGPKTGSTSQHLRQERCDAAGDTVLAIRRNPGPSGPGGGQREWDTRAAGRGLPPTPRLAPRDRGAQACARASGTSAPTQSPSCVGSAGIGSAAQFPTCRPARG
jgi:hypothetical protein